MSHKTSPHQYALVLLTMAVPPRMSLADLLTKPAPQSFGTHAEIEEWLAEVLGRPIADHVRASFPAAASLTAKWVWAGTDFKSVANAAGLNYEAEGPSTLVAGWALVGIADAAGQMISPVGVAFAYYAKVRNYGEDTPTDAEVSDFMARLAGQVDRTLLLSQLVRGRPDAIDFSDEEEKNEDVPAARLD